MSLPALFVSHGAPTLATEPSAARDFLAGLGRALADRGVGRPRAILAVSGHWQAAEPRLSGSTATIHDFTGFPEDLYRLRYPAPAAPELAAEAMAALATAGYAASVEPERGLDHGVWVPLMLMYPAAEVPVVQLSLLAGRGPADHFRLGAALRPLREAGVLVLGSGGFTHNLRQLDWREPAGPEAAWAAEYAAWMDAVLVAGRTDDLLAYRERAPHGARSHPEEEHLLPLFVALGAGTPGGRAERLHASHQYGTLRLDAYAFD